VLGEKTGKYFRGCKEANHDYSRARFDECGLKRHGKCMCFKVVLRWHVGINFTVPINLSKEGARPGGKWGMLAGLL